MKKHFVLAAMIAVTLVGNTKADLIANWTFETSVPTTSGPLTPEFGAGSATSNTGGTFSNPVGNGSVESWSSNGWDTGEYFQFSVSTLGFENIAIAWEQTGSNTGPRDFQLQYQVNGGGFSNALSYSLIVSNWSSSTANTGHDFSFDFSAIPALNNAANVDFRLTMLGTTSINGGAVASTGTGRVDNVSVTGFVQIPEPGSAALLGLGLVGLRLVRRRK